MLTLERSENVMPVIVGCLVSIVESKRSWSSAVFLRLFIFQLRFLCIAVADDSRAVPRQIICRRAHNFHIVDSKG